jgi:hypothetical protein
MYDALGRELGLEHEIKAIIQEGKKPEAGPPGAEKFILEGISRLQPIGQKRALVSIRELRRFLPLSKSDFDRAVLDLALQGRVALHHHDFPTSLTPVEREELVQDKQGTYYVGIVPKEMA